jgi:hypothetical protein
MGYIAVSALEEFGAGGLANLGQENTYLKLCNEGIDAVIVVAIVDNNKENHLSSRKSNTYPDNYYYDRIWNYKNIQADLAGENRGEHENYFWEAILFKLNTREAECTIQSRAFTSITNERILKSFVKNEGFNSAVNTIAGNVAAKAAEGLTDWMAKFLNKKSS